MENLDALEQMREQMQMLKDKLEQQEIINDQMLRKVTQTRMKHLNRNIWQEGLAGLFVITFGTYIFHNMGCSLWFILATVALMIVCFVLTLVSHHRVDLNNIAQGDLLTAAKQVKKLRKFYQQWKYISIPILLPWFGWLVWEIFRASEGDHRILISTLIGLVIGLITGGIIGWIRSNRLIREMDIIIQDLEKTEE